MLQYGHLELADTVMDPGNLQHNPNVPQGRDGFKKFMSANPNRTPREIKPEWLNPPSLTLVSGPTCSCGSERTKTLMTRHTTTCDTTSTSFASRTASSRSTGMKPSSPRRPHARNAAA